MPVSLSSISARVPAGTDPATQSMSMSRAPSPSDNDVPAPVCHGMTVDSECLMRHDGPRAAKSLVLHRQSNLRPAGRTVCRNVFDLNGTPDADWSGAANVDEAKRRPLSG